MSHDIFVLTVWTTEITSEKYCEVNKQDLKILQYGLPHYPCNPECAYLRKLIVAHVAAYFSELSSNCIRVFKCIQKTVMLKSLDKKNTLHLKTIALLMKCRTTCNFEVKNNSIIYDTKNDKIITDLKSVWQKTFSCYTVKHCKLYNKPF